MAEIIWTESALKDADSIYECISVDSEYYAAKLLDKLFSRVQILLKFPFAGKKMYDFRKPNYYELIEGNYRIIYLVASRKKIYIVRIHHSSRKLK